MDIISEICKAYALKGTIKGVSCLKRGHINGSYRVDLDVDGKEKSYLFQRVNNYVFKEPEKIMKNVRAVTDHIRRKLEAAGEADIKRKVIKLYTHDGESLYITDGGEYWRVMSFVYGAATYDVYDNKLLRSVGYGFGRFLSMLSDFPGGDLYETIPDFHNTPKRYESFFNAYKADVKGRAADISDEAAFIKKTAGYAPRFIDLYDKGKLPLRVTHNDTKGNNIMIDVKTGEPLAVIDLDTVMPGFAMNDFGDAVRYAANTAAEDEPDLSKVALDLERYKALADGFLPPMKGKYTDLEIANMPWGVILMTLEIAVRFLTDYLEGDVYFKTDYPEHNLVRGRCQLALAKDAISKLPDMEKITENYL